MSVTPFPQAEMTAFDRSASGIAMSLRVSSGRLISPKLARCALFGNQIHIEGSLFDIAHTHACVCVILLFARLELLLIQIKLLPQRRLILQHPVLVKEDPLPFKQFQLHLAIDATRSFIPFSFESSNILQNIESATIKPYKTQ